MPVCLRFLRSVLVRTRSSKLLTHRSQLPLLCRGPVSWDLTLSKAGSEVGSDQEPLVSRLPDVFALDEPRLLPTRSRRILFAIEAAYVSDPDEGVSAHESSRSVEVKC